MHTTWKAAALAAMVTASPLALAKQKICVFDILGTSGDGYNSAKDYAVEMQKHGADIELKAYIDERVAVEDFRTGQCDAVMATALRTRPEPARPPAEPREGVESADCQFQYRLYPLFLHTIDHISRHARVDRSLDSGAIALIDEHRHRSRHCS